MSEHGWLDELLAREDARNPVPAGLRRDVVAAVTTDHDMERRTSRVLVLAAAALVMAVVVSLVAIGRFAHPTGGVPAHRPSPSPSPTAERDYGPVPAGVAVTYGIDPRRPSWLIAYDASGRPVGTVKLPEPVTLSGGTAQAGGLNVTASAGGDLIITSDQIYDRAGQPIAPSPWGTKGPLVVADDQRHICSVAQDPQTFVNTLSTELIGQPSRAVAAINREQGLGQTGDTVALCSFQHDVAVVVRTAIMYPTDAWFVRISTGAVIRHLTFPAESLSTITVSPDGAYVAENRATLLKADPGYSLAPATTIVRVSDGKVMADLGRQLVFHFVGAGEVVTTADDGLPTSHQVALVDWQTGRTLWSYQASDWVDFMQPLGDSAWVVWLAQPQPGNPTTVNPPCDRVIFLHADGTQSELGDVSLYPVQAF